MTLGSLYARIAKTNRSLRFRKKTPYLLYDKSEVVLCGVYRRQDYMGFCLDSRDVWYRSRPIKRVRIQDRRTGESDIQIITRRRRGRFEFANLMRSHGLIGRAGLQLIKL
jgi:hypothetical protein